MSIAVPISGAEEFAWELLQSAREKAAALARAGQPPLFISPGFATRSLPEGLIDDSAAVIELVLKHRLACHFRRQGDTRERQAIEAEVKELGHNARRVFERLSGSTKEAIRFIYGECLCGYDDFAAIYGKMADFEEMLAWVQSGPGYRYTPASAEPHVPIGWCWSPPDTLEVKALPSFPNALANWASEEFNPERSLNETLEALLGGC